MGHTTEAELRDRARHMRKNQTAEEHKLWQHLRAKRLDGRKFRRQHVLVPYIVDYYCFAEKLAVEVDGAAHDGTAHEDCERDEYLQDVYGVRVVRVSAEEVLMDIESVLGRIRDAFCEA